MEEVLRASRARAEAYSADLAAWEVDTARARNEGTFFKGLFKADVLQPEGTPRGGGAGGATGAPSTSGVRQACAACCNLPMTVAGLKAHPAACMVGLAR